MISRQNNNISLEKLILSLAKDWMMIIVVICLISILFLYLPGELTFKTMVSIGHQFVVMGLICMGLLFVFYSGQFDFSLGGVFTACLFSFSFLLQQTNILVALLAILFMAIILGLITGYLSIAFNNSLLITIVILFTLQGVIYILTRGLPSTHDLGNDEVLYQLAWGVYMQIPISAILFICIGLVLHYFCRSTLWGIGLMATGIDVKRAAYMGLKVNRIRIAVFVFAAIMTSLASMIYYSRVSTISPGAGNNIVFNALAVIVIGNGGLKIDKPSPLRIIFVAYLLVLLELCFGMLGLSSEAMYSVTGCLIILSLLFGYYINK